MKSWFRNSYRILHKDDGFYYAVYYREWWWPWYSDAYPHRLSWFYSLEQAEQAAHRHANNVVTDLGKLP